MFSLHYLTVYTIGGFAAAVPVHFALTLGVALLVRLRFVLQFVTFVELI